MKTAAGYAGANEIDRTRAGFKRRMQEIDRLNTSDVKALDRTMKEWVALEREDMRRTVVSELLKCLERLVIRTPFETGRARAAWQIDTSRSQSVPPEGQYPEYQDDKKVPAAIAKALSSVPPLTQADVIYIMNNVEYILALDAGWSRETAGGFIGLFLQELRHQLEAAAATSARGEA